MLPFLKPQKRESGIAMEYRKPDETKEMNSDDLGLEACGEDLIKAVHNHDKKGVVAAIKAAFQILESMPHQENMEGHESE